MGAPTWPPDPKRAFALTAEEYGVAPEDIGDEAAEDERAERALLAAFLFRSPDRQVVSGERNGTTLAEVQRPLAAWLRMISGHSFRIAASDPATTDGVDLFLPRAVPAPREATDEQLFRAMGLVQLGLVRWGLLRSHGVLAETTRDPVLRACWHLLAARWVLQRWSADWPGIARDLAGLPTLEKAGILRVNLTVVPADGMPGAFRPLYAGLLTCLSWAPSGTEAERAQEAVAREAIRAVASIPHDGAAPLVLAGQARRLREHLRRLRLGPPPLPYVIGILRPEWVVAERAHDPEAENAWMRGPSPLRELRDAQARGGSVADLPPPAAAPRTLGSLLKRGLRRALQGPGDPAELARTPAYGLLRDEHQALPTPTATRTWTTGVTPEDLLQDTPPPRPTDDEGTEYDEWDEETSTWRVGWTRVVDPPAFAGPPEPYARIREVRAREIREIRRRFEALRVEERWLHGQPDGSEIDLDGAVRAVCDVAAGQDPDPRIWRQFVRRSDPVAILTLVDQSGSTQGRVIHLEQEALVLVAEGLKALAFPHAFYGFHNEGRRECRMERIKGFDEPYAEPVYRRLGNLRPGGATRLGAFVRHATTLLERQPQARRLLLVLSDGRPQDRGDYQGETAIRDSALAVVEARRRGLHVRCVSLDDRDEAEAYLVRIFGRGEFLRVPDVDRLPERLVEVVRAGVA